MSHSARHMEKRRVRARQKAYENRMRRHTRGAGRPQAVSPDTLRGYFEEQGRRRTLWQRLRGFFNRLVTKFRRS